MGMVVEKAEHLLRGIGPFGIAKRAARTPARPSVAGAMHQPMFYDGLTVRVKVDGTRIGMAVWDLAPLNAHARSGAALGWCSPSGMRRRTLGNHLVAIARMHRRIPVAVEHDGGDGRARSVPAGRGPLPQALR
jgi:hypothetical protein